MLATRSQLVLSSQVTQSEHLDLGEMDNRFRRIGVMVYRGEADFVAAEEGAGWCYSYEPGHYFKGNTQVTRNGEPYGASNRTEYFKTEAEREAFLAKRIEAAKRTARKNGAKLQQQMAGF